MNTNVPSIVTGAAGFIGFHLADRLLALGHRVVGCDNINDYYDVALKEARLDVLRKHENFEFYRCDIADAGAMRGLFDRYRFKTVFHLAAQAGVRYSLENPEVYINSNVVGFLNVLECCRHGGVEHLIYASSSSVYGLNEKLPFSEDDPVDHPASLYAATKKSNELMAHTYSHLFGIPTTGLRFFTVYGPWGRPDMAVFKFTQAILAGKPIDVYNNGRMKRDFTYVDDIIDGIIRISREAPKSDISDDYSSPARSRAPFQVFNIGHNEPVELTRLIEVLEAALGKKATKKNLPIQLGDVLSTHAEIGRLQSAVGFSPRTTIEEGVSKFVAWYLEYHE